MRYKTTLAIPNKIHTVLIPGLGIGICFVIYNAWIHSFTIQAVALAVVGGGSILFKYLQSKGVSITIPSFAYHWKTIAILAFLIYCYFYFTSDILPGETRRGWFDWWDQSQYLNMAKEMNGFDLKAENYFYGIGYPILGAIFYKIYPPNPFLVPNLVLYVITMLLYHRIAGAYLNRELALIVLLLMMLGTQITDFFVVPWNNISSLVGIGVLIYIAVVVDRINIWHSMAIGLVIGWVFASRYVDAIFLLPIAGYIFFKVIRNNGYHEAKYFIISGMIFLIIVGVVLHTHKMVFGSYFKTPYHKHTSMTDGGDKFSSAAFQLNRVPDHLYSIIVNPHQFHHIGYLKLNTPMLGYSFLFVFSLPGFILQISDKKDSLAGILLGSMIIAFIFYGSFSATRASDLKYNCLRYFSMWYPILTIMGVMFILKLFDLSNTGTNQRRLIYGGISITLIGVLINYLYLHSEYMAQQRKMLDPSHWVLTSNYNNKLLSEAVDRDFTTRWDTGIPQKPGMYYQVEFESIRTLEKIVLNCAGSLNDYPRGIRVDVSIDGNNWESVFHMEGVALPLLTDGSLVIGLPQVQAKVVRLIQTGIDDQAYWSIHELEIYGQ